MSNDKIKRLSEEGRGSRGVPKIKIDEMAEWLKIQDKVDEYFERIDQLEEQAVEEIFEKADVICSTNSTAGSEIMENKRFDLLVLDEATQSTEPSAVIPLTKAKKVILAGDHKQLPPTILNEEAKKEGLGKSLFERLLEVHGNQIKEVLRVQYRMNKNIMNFSAEEFYPGTVKAAPEVENWTLDDLNIKKPASEIEQFVFNSKKPIVFLDTLEKDAIEYSKKDSKSYSNKYEAELAKDFLKKSVDIGIDPEQIALIAPYKDQVEMISKWIENEAIEIDTVDGFQGREKELVILSLVRSNKSGNIGFLEDLRRLNVSITRAKKKLIIIGDSSTITTHEIYARMIEYIKDQNGYYTL